MPKRKASNAAAIYPENTAKGLESPNSKDKLINEANALSVTEFKSRYIKDESLRYSRRDADNTSEFRIDFKSSSQLNEDELTTCLKLIESTSRPDYEGSSIGWYPRRKKREMKEDEMRYLLVRQVHEKNKTSSASVDPIEGFLSFMLTHDSIPAVPVVYIYEIHLAKSLRKLGLGAHLMDIVESVAEKVGVDKLMLTCFLSNDKARSFYERRGYGVDVSSPEDRTTRGKTIKVDYLIMSKGVPRKVVDEVVR